MAKATVPSSPDAAGTLPRTGRNQPLEPADFEARQILKAELRRKGVTIVELASRLSRDGQPETAKALAMRLNRGGFSFAFALRVFRAIGATNPDFSKIEVLENE